MNPGAKVNEKRGVTQTTVRASTLVLSRDATHGMEVYLLKRSDKSDFMARHYVFPGGVVESDDGDWSFWESRVDVSAEDVAGRLGNTLSFELALAHSVAAVRETFEECRVLIALERRAGSQGSEDPHGPGQNRSGATFRGKIAREGWVLALSFLRPWSHWITPVVRPKRYDTRFYLAGMPQGQECLPDQREMTHGLWIRPEEALERNMNGNLRLGPPTLVTLHEIMNGHRLSPGHGEAERTLWGETRVPRWIVTSRGPVLMLPWDPDFSEAHPVDRPGFETRPLPVGVPFSKLWLDNGIWRPVG
jgi:8-oxo-dGTP pyrophosphatase MutT (NUDIX family)